MKKALLTLQERQQLTESGYSRADIHEITLAIKNTQYHLVNKDGTKEKISEEEAQHRLGRDEWLKAVARTAFHVDAVRYGINNEKITVHSKIYA